jgi:hypothetical protein
MGKAVCPQGRELPEPSVNFSEEAPVRLGLGFRFGRLSPLLLATGASILIVVLAGARASSSAHPASAGVQAAQSVSARQATDGPCTGATCMFPLGVNPALLNVNGSFFCPAIANAQAQIRILNHVAAGGQNDIMFLTASGLPKNTLFDLFLVQHSPLDSGAFSGFGFGWYQSDVQSNASGVASVKVQGIFDVETFIENPADQFTPIHTYNVGFWFDSPTEEATVCGSATPAATPFNGEQHAGLLAMITQGEPLQFVK